MEKKSGGRVLSNRRYVKILLGMFLVGFVMCFMYKDASAFGNLLKSDETNVFAGTIVNLRDFVDDSYMVDSYGEDYSKEKDEQLLSYQFNIANRDNDCAELDSYGNLTTKKPGTVIIDIKYSYKSVFSIVPFTINIMEPEKVNISYGKSTSIEAASIYNAGTYTYSSEKDSVIVDNDGMITVQGFKSSKIYATGEKGEKIEVADISVNIPEYNDDVAVRAVGTEPYTPQINNYESLDGDKPIEWTSKNEDIMKVIDGKLEAVGIGDTNVSAAITAKNGDVENIEVPVTVTDPIIPNNKMVVAVGGKKAIKLQGTCQSSAVKMIKSEKNKVSLTDDGKLYADKKGNDTITVSVDGKELGCDVTITDPSLQYTTIVTYKGGKRRIPIQGTVSDSDVTYKSKNVSAVDVTSGGVINAKKSGHVKVVADVDGKKITANVEIASKNAYRAAKKEIEISKTKTRYSQAKRMSAHYYDCSSIVWRTYRRYGVNFGVKSSWAPTAASMGYWCAKNNKVIYKKGVSASKLLPGDVIFYSYQKNGRYKNISHVEMYVGNGKSVSASSAHNRVIHYTYKNRSVVMIARPTK